MKGTKTRLTTAPEGFEYYRVCDQEGVCQVVRGMWAEQRLTEDIRELSATKTKYSDDWIQDSERQPASPHTRAMAYAKKRRLNKSKEHWQL